MPSADSTSELQSAAAEMLKKEDWRFHAIGQRGGGTVSIATQEFLGDGEIVGFGLPSPPALFLNLAFTAHRVRSAFDVKELFETHPVPQGRYPDNHSRLFDYFEAAIQEIVFSYSAIESAVNEIIPQEFKYQKSRRNQHSLLSKQDIERQVSLEEKLKLVLPQALNVSSPAGGALWPSYLQLQGMRNRLVHLKSVDRKASGSEDQTIWGDLLRLETTLPEAAARMIEHFYSPTRRWLKLRPLT